MHFHIIYLLHHYGYGAVFLILLFEMIGIPFPAETTLTFAGIGMTQGAFAFLPLILAAALGNITGSTIAYWIGSSFGRKAIVRYGKYIGLTDKRLDKAEAQFLKYKIPVLLFSKFIAGIRVFVPYLAGINKIPFVTFSIVNAISAVLWVVVFTLLGRTIHQAWHRLLPLTHHGLLILAVFCILALTAWILKKSRRVRDV